MIDDVVGNLFYIYDAEIIISSLESYGNIFNHLLQNFSSPFVYFGASNYLVVASN